jgi:elongation factor G
MGSGVLGGYPVVDIKVTVVDGSFHEVDSSEMAFKIAGSMGFKEGMKKGDPVLLEPVMRVDIEVPEDYMGDVIGGLNARRGVIKGINGEDGIQSIQADVPLSNMFGYATVLRSSTQGRGTFVMQISHFAEIPKNIMETVLKK